MENMENKKDSSSGGCTWILLIFAAIIVGGAYLNIGPFKGWHDLLFGEEKKEKVEQKAWDGSFTGSDHNKGRKCSKIVGAGGTYCSCSGCNPGNWDAFTCSNCGHKCDIHTR